MSLWNDSRKKLREIRKYLLQINVQNTLSQQTKVSPLPLKKNNLGGKHKLFSFLFFFLTLAHGIQTSGTIQKRRSSSRDIIKAFSIITKTFALSTHSNNPLLLIYVGLLVTVEMGLHRVHVPNTKWQLHVAAFRSLYSTVKAKVVV